MPSMPSHEPRHGFVTHLECSVTRARVAADEVHGLSAAARAMISASIRR